MTAILYPVAPDAEAALAQPLGRAARAREARGLAGEAVVFVTEPVGAAYANRAAALEAHGARVDDAGAEDRYCRLAETLAGGTAPRAAAPVYQDGRRWPAAPTSAPKTVWRLQVSYWRPVSAQAATESAQAREARRGAAREPMDSQALRNLTRQPLRPVRPQQPLDIGLFETRLPENPNIVVPDE